MMQLRGGACPECGVMATHPERIMGAQTLDVVCDSCGHIGWWKDFHPDAAKNDAEKSRDDDQQAE